MSKERPKILFVAMPSAIHTARWIQQLSGQGWDLHLFSPDAASDLTIHPEMPGDVLLHLIARQNRSGTYQTGIKLPFSRGDRIRSALTKVFEAFVDRPTRLANLIERLQPDVVHSLQMQGPTYVTAEAHAILEKRGRIFPKWVYSSWGSDIYLFGEDPYHAFRIKDALARVNYLISDCERDVQLAREFGFRGETLGIYPTGGGFEVAALQAKRTIPVANRKVIAIKGIIRQQNVGRPMIALDAVELCGDRLKDHEIVVYSADGAVKERIDIMKKKGNVNIRVLEPMSHDEFVGFIGQTKISIGLNVSDGTPNTMLEAMIMGAFPIQSDTVSTGEWIKSGVNGFLVHPEDPGALCDAILKAIGDDALLETAAAVNNELVVSKFERTRITSEVLDTYLRLSDNSASDSRKR